MNLKCNRIIRVTIGLIFQLIFSHQLFAEKGPFHTDALLGSQNRVQVDQESFVTDATYFSPISPIETTHFIKNMVSVGIEEESKYFIQSDFTATVVLRIIKYNQAHQAVEQLDKTFIVNYNKAIGTTYNSTQYFPFENAYEVTVKIISITPNAGVTWDIKKVLRVDNTLQATRDYIFNCSKTIVGLTGVLETSINELSVSWTDPTCGQTEYDLEWAWIDESAITEYKSGNNYLEDKIFENNSTRVTVEGSIYNYKVPLLYDGDGRIFIRVRPAQLKYS